MSIFSKVTDILIGKKEDAEVVEAPAVETAGSEDEEIIVLRKRPRRRSRKGKPTKSQKLTAQRKAIAEIDPLDTWRVAKEKLNAVGIGNRRAERHIRKAKKAAGTYTGFRTDYVCPPTEGVAAALEGHLPFSALVKQLKVLGFSNKDARPLVAEAREAFKVKAKETAEELIKIEKEVPEGKAFDSNKVSEMRTLLEEAGSCNGKMMTPEDAHNQEARYIISDRIQLVGRAAGEAPAVMSIEVDGEDKIYWTEGLGDGADSLIEAAMAYKKKQEEEEAALAAELAKEEATKEKAEVADGTAA